MRRKRPHATRRVMGRFGHRWSLAGLGLGATVQAGGRSLLSLGLSALMLALIGLLVANLVGQVLQSARLDAHQAALATEVAQMEAEQRTLEGAVAFAESDVNVERIAREQLGYARTGDTVIFPQLPAATPAPALAATPAPAPAPAAPNWRGWLDAFFPPNS